VSCTENAGTWTIINFAALTNSSEITVTLSHMIPPLNSGNTDSDYQMFDSIATTYNDGTTD
jgi:hypothetical protein